MPRFEQTAKYGKSPIAWHVPEPEPILNRDLEEFSRRLSMLSTPGVEGVYQTAYRDCAFKGNRLPPAVAVQQLVAAWRVLRKIRNGKQ